MFTDTAGKIAGEIDVELDKVIIEVTAGKGGKVDQLTKLISDKVMNPSGKPVILYAPNYGKFAVQSATSAGAKVARTLAELDALVKSLGRGGS